MGVKILVTSHLKQNFFKHLKNEDGQSAIEYILIIGIVVNFAVLIVNWMKQSQLEQKIMAPLSQDYAMTYKYGHPKAKGFDEGSPNAQHPRAVVGGRVRLFINPR